MFAPLKGQFDMMIFRWKRNANESTVIVRSISNDPIECIELLDAAAADKNK